MIPAYPQALFSYLCVFSFDFPALFFQHQFVVAYAALFFLGLLRGRGRAKRGRRPHQLAFSLHQGLIVIAQFLDIYSSLLFQFCFPSLAFLVMFFFRFPQFFSSRFFVLIF